LSSSQAQGGQAQTMTISFTPGEHACDANIADPDGT
jgi:hypothetical protein